MSNFINLTKVFFLTGFGVNKKKNKQTPILKQIGLMAILFSVVSIGYNAMMFLLPETAMATDYRDILIFMVTISSFLVFITTFNQIQSVLFNSTDYEFIQSLPVTNATVIAAKIMALLLICIGEDIIIFLPTTVFYLIFAHDVFGTIISFVTIFFISFVPLLISSIVGTLIALATKRVKNKNIFQTIVYLMYFGVVFFISFSMNGSNIIDKKAVSNVLPHILLYKEALFSYNIVPYLIFIAVNIAAFAFVVGFISLLYKPVNAAKQNVGDGKYKLEKSTGESVNKVLFKKELKMVTGKANVFINAIMGCIMYPVTFILTMLINVPEGEQTKYLSVIVYFIPFLGLIMSSIMSPTSSSISLEGKNFEMLLSYPLTPKEIIKAKIKAGLLIPACLYIASSSIIVVIMMIKGMPDTFTWPLIASVYLAPQLGLLFTTLVGSLCNLNWPKTEYENEMQVIKNSKSVVMSMLFCFFPSFVVGGIVTGTCFVSPIISLIVLVVVYGAGAGIVYGLINKHGDRLFKDITNK